MNLAFNREALSLGQSFSLAAWVVIIGVVVSWVYLKQGVGQVAADLPEIPSFTLTTIQDVGEVSFLERAEQAYAAGRITRPEGDSALFFYQKMLERDPQNQAAQEGVQRVVGYLINGAEGALLKEDWSTAADFAEQVLAVNASNIAAKSIISRVERYERIKRLNDRAIEQIASGNLTKPVNNNALASYREILRIDPGNAAALQGVESVAQRLATIAQTAAFAEDHDRAKELIALAKSIAPNAPGIAQTEKLTLQWTDMVKDQAVKEDLLAAARAMQAGQLVGADSPSGVGALEHYRSVLKKDPNSAAARSGIELIVEGLIEQGWSAARGNRIDAVESAVENALGAGASQTQLAGLSDELDFLKRRAQARAGIFSDVLPIRDLVAKRQQAPVLPRNATGGWVELLFTVNEDGDVEDIAVVESSSDSLHDPAINAVNKWRFEPFEDDGRPIPVRTGVRFSFQT